MATTGRGCSERCESQRTPPAHKFPNELTVTHTIVQFSSHLRCAFGVSCRSGTFQWCSCRESRHNQDEYIVKNTEKYRKKNNWCFHF